MARALSATRRPVQALSEASCEDNRKKVLAGIMKMIMQEEGVVGTRPPEVYI